MSGERERERQAHEEQLRISEAAALIVENAAATAYLDEIERRAIDAMLEAEATDDIGRLKLSVVAKAIRQMKQFLREQKPAGEFAAAMLERIQKEENAR